MERRNWTEQDLIERLYGVSGVPAEQVAAWEATPEYRAAWARLRKLAADKPPVPEPDFAAQRRRIYERLERPRAGWPRWLSAGMATAALATVLVWNRPGPPAPPADEISDTQFFEELVAFEQTAEPRAAAAVRELFRGN